MGVVAGAKYPSVEIDTGDQTPIGDDEPVFIIRAQDSLAPELIARIVEVYEDHDVPPDTRAQTLQALTEVEEYQRANPALVKLPT